MDISIVVQTCDRYEKFWQGFFYYMDKFWDKNINCPIYFCNEEKNIDNNQFVQLKTGKNTATQNLKFILNNIKSKYIFYIIEDFWPLCNFNKELFASIFNYILEKDIKSFQISPIVPYYKLIKTNVKIGNNYIHKFSPESDWRFNFQARIWEKNFLLNCLHEPKISENKLNSTIGMEIECCKYFPKNIEIYLYHYFWYPLSGVSYRGEFTKLGLEMQNNMLVDFYGKNQSI